MDKPKASQKCEEPIAHYLELGCRPVHSKRNGRCPERYECPFMERSLDPKKCFYKWVFCIVYVMLKMEIFTTE